MNDWRDGVNDFCDDINDSCDVLNGWSAEPKVDFNNIID